jgi:gliding motility-associated-like protein
LEETYNIRYFYRSPEGCSNSATKAIRVQFPPDVQLSKNGSACEDGGSFTIDVLKSPSAKHPYGLTWSIVGGTGTIIDSTNTKLTYAPSAAEKLAGKVTVNIITNNNGLCAAASDQSDFIINPKPVADFTGIDSACVRPGIPLNVTLTAAPNPVPNCNYIWEIDGTVEIDSLNKDVFNKSFTTAKVYPIKLTVINKTTGCNETSAIKNSTAWLTPTADFDPDKLETTIAKPYFTFTNKTNPLTGNTYLWDLSIDPQTLVGRTSTEIHPKDISFIADTAQIAIKLVAISDKGCIDSVTKFIRINPDITVFIPNAFYPQTKGVVGSGSTLPLSECEVNGIPCNRYFFIQAQGFESIEIYVYNRWGKLVYESKDIKQGWDGTDMKSGGECQQDAYVYQIFANSFSGKRYQYSGSVTLLR